MYKLKNVAERIAAFMAAVSMLAGLGTSVLPQMISADALNPLTERSLTLSSSSPGWSYTDGSGNAFAEGQTWNTYAPPNSGANGKETGETFTFRVSSDATIKAFTFQYCTAPAGLCQAPGDDTTTQTAGTGTITTTTSSATVTGVGTKFTTELHAGEQITTAGSNTYTIASIANDTSLTLTATPTVAESGVTFTYPTRTDSSTTSDFNVVDDTTTNAEISATNYATISASASGVPPRDNSEGNFVVLTPSNPGVAGNTANTVSAGWSMSVKNKEESTTTQTGKNNYITITNNTGQALQPGDQVKVVFFATDKNYITNPGSSAFFAKINDYNSSTTQDDTTLVDGGVTVANVMNFSIAINTKVLETMDFSVGTVDPDTLSAGTTSELATATGGARTAHGQCDPILNSLNPANTPNVLAMGDSNAENSLRTDTTYATHSYWRLSSNSTGGATVYYSGVTLSDTENDQIAPVGANAAAPLTGSEQFGLALDNGSASPYGVDYSWAPSGTESGGDAGIASGGGLSSDWNASSFADGHNPQLAPLVPEANYGDGTGVINAAAGTINTKFAFDPNANTVPVPMASEDTSVVDCVTGKVRYMANIAATTPAGIYTTKINYIAAPEY